ncbi:hypothetical protein AGMMS49982_04800 [Bacteroidia bacterium]|nr:hypothetical protein AGMMS49982_04800 [Bacteroidia bacterium]
MTIEDIKTVISKGETSTVQFKIRTDDAYKIGIEMVAFANMQGGIIIVGVDDNALIHRDYYINAPIRVFIFDNRIEIHSPGILPDSVTEETIKNGISVPRNRLLFDNAKFLLPYTGIGSGILRVLQSYDKIDFRNNIPTEKFVITFLRDEIPEEMIIEDVNVPAKFGVNVGVNVGVKFGVNIENILQTIEQNPNITVKALSEIVQTSTRAVEKNLAKLKAQGIIERIGADKNGYWQIIDNE